MKRKLLEAISFSARKHEGQKRKDGITPYAAHPFRVAMLLATALGVDDEEVLAAAVLHDAIEDTTADFDEVLELFGERVAGFVAVLSKDKRLPEDERERAYLERLAGAPVEAKLVKLGDTLDNLFDSAALTPAARSRAVRRARELVERLAPGFPREWQRALDLVREEVARLEGAPVERV
jgi:guanosine-3',5'-bis(diphosphate) 3'-pyrophosphohydrolase